MTTLFTRRILGRRLARASALGLLALAAVLLQHGEARAQWTTSGTTTSTTNTVGVGTAAPVSSLHVTTSTSAFPRGITNEQTSVDNNAAMYVFRKSRAGAAVTTGDNIGNLYAEAFDGAAFISPARLRFAVDGPVAVGSIPTALQFFTGTGGGGGLERMRISSGGNVGIGTATPGTLNGVNFMAYVPLHVQGLAGAMANVVVDSALPTSGYVLNDSSQPIDGRIWAITQAAGGGKLTFSTYADAGARTDRVVIDRTGNLGVGTLAPVSKLHVAGNITVDGNINAKYQDVAEWVPSTQKLLAGTVVILDTGRDNHVLASKTAYDTRVAGVISAQPGLSLGEAGEGKVLVATTGRVKVKVDATKGAIKIGDLIVTSDVAGVAMKSQPVSVGGVDMHRPGTLIGKALESLEKGTGEILVLLSLQ
jgi:hypothetical protein